MGDSLLIKVDRRDGASWWALPNQRGPTFLAWYTVIRGQRRKEDLWFDYDHGGGCILIWSDLFCSVLCIYLLLVFESLKCCLILMSVRKVPPLDDVAGAPIMHPRKTRRYRESYYGWWRTRSSSSRKCQLGSRDSDTRKSCMNRACMFFVRLACT